VFNFRILIKTQNIFKFAVNTKSVVKYKVAIIKVYKNIVVYAAGREERPYITNDQRECCPFCAGNENLTPDPSQEVIDKETWLLRSFPNKYPIFSFLGALNFGYHEIIVETPEHGSDVVSFSDEHYKNLLMFYQDRISAILAMQKIEAVFFFKNYGVKAGASISHAHAQIIGADTLPERLLEKYQQDRYYFRDVGICGLCEQVKNKNTTFCVFETEYFIVQIPETSRFSYEIEIIPRRHISGYLELTKLEIENLVRVLKKAFGILRIQLKQFDYNMLFSPTLKNNKFNAGNHFKINIVPRNSFMGGFELLTGLFVNGVMPKAAAESLRAIYSKQKVV